MTLPQLFEDSVSKYGDNPLLFEKTTDKFVASSYKEIKEKVYLFAAGLLALGIKKGDRIALLAEGRNDWVISELGILYTGAINVPLSIKLNEPEEIKFRLDHSGAKMIIVSGRQEHKVSPLQSSVETLENIILLDPKDNPGEKEISFSSIMAKGKEYLNDNTETFTNTWQSIKGDDYANICYTSGTTADPKGIILSHRNYTSNIEQSQTLHDIAESYTTLLILPWDHAFAHTCGIYTMMKSGASMSSIELGDSPMDTLKNIPINIKETGPVFLLSVPALANNFKKNIEAGIRAKGPKVEKLFNKALKLAYSYNGMGWDKGKGMKFLKKPILALYDKILFSKIRKGFGENLSFFVGGGALLDIELQRFFFAIGLPMYQGYGLTEASPVISSNAPGNTKFGSSGIIADNIELKICDDKGNALPVGEKGEIVIKGENVMQGYWENPESTKETIKDGWLYSGDMGYMDKDGYLYVTGRFKSLLIADDGEKYSPEGIEEALVSNSEFIDQCMLFNNQNPYTIVLIVPNKETIKRWAQENEIDLNVEAGKEKALLKIESEIRKYRTGGEYDDLFPQRWIPSTIAVLEEGFSESNHLINSTMKMVRGKIIEKYTKLIEFLYTPEAKKIANSNNMSHLMKLWEE